jgi:hypothetical protein
MQVALLAAGWHHLIKYPFDKGNAASCALRPNGYKFLAWMRPQMRNATDEPFRAATGGPLRRNHWLRVDGNSDAAVSILTTLARPRLARDFEGINNTSGLTEQL